MPSFPGQTHIYDSKLTLSNCKFLKVYEKHKIKNITVCVCVRARAHVCTSYISIYLNHTIYLNGLCR